MDSKYCKYNFMESENERFRAARQDLGLTLQDVALMTGYSVPAISGVENGHDRPSRRLRALLIERLGLREDWITTGKGNMFKDSKEMAVANMVSKHFQSPAEEDITNDPEFVSVINKLRIMRPVERKQYLAALHRLLDDLIKMDKKFRRKKNSLAVFREEADRAVARVILNRVDELLGQKKEGLDAK